MPQGALESDHEALFQDLWNEAFVEEWAGVRKRDPNASCGRVFSILGEKNAERHAPIGEREYKARIVRGQRDPDSVWSGPARIVSGSLQRSCCDGFDQGRSCRVRVARMADEGPRRGTSVRSG